MGQIYFILLNSRIKKTPHFLPILPKHQKNLSFCPLSLNLTKFPPSNKQNTYANEFEEFRADFVFWDLLHEHNFCVHFNFYIFVGFHICNVQHKDLIISTIFFPNKAKSRRLKINISHHGIPWWHELKIGVSSFSIWWCHTCADCSSFPSHLWSSAREKC